MAVARSNRVSGCRWRHVYAIGLALMPDDLRWRPVVRNRTAFDHRRIQRREHCVTRADAQDTIDAVDRILNATAASAPRTR
jgi:hypothetical protein